MRNVGLALVCMAVVACTPQTTTVAPVSQSTATTSASAPASASAAPVTSPAATPSKDRTEQLKGWPNASNTGVPDGVELAKRGSIRVDKDGTVLDGLDIEGEVSVQADNVTIRNSRIVNVGHWGVIQRKGATGLTIVDSEIRGNGTEQMQFGILNQGGMLTVRRTDISVISNGIQTDHGLIEDSYFHDPLEFPQDHVDMILSTGEAQKGLSLVIRRNTIINTVKQTAAVALFQDFGVPRDTIVEKNILAGGGYALYAGGGKKGTPTGIKIIGNVFLRDPFPKGGFWGPVTGWDGSGKGNVWRDNVWEGGKSTVHPSEG
ncbi:hypothetical protein ACIBH1_34130 [Nonomuraea sp. NPDC050663]|uniref:hypothetical protein n=1 Tax=Nonomuraea sp. NPDC050663 TaxID=3364370 RepID=UPI0037954FC9